MLHSNSAQKGPPIRGQSEWPATWRTARWCSGIDGVPNATGRRHSAISNCNSHRGGGIALFSMTSAYVSVGRLALPVRRITIGVADLSNSQWCFTRMDRNGSRL